jgi:tight adherence protein C
MNEFMQLGTIFAVVAGLVFPVVFLLLRARQRRDGRLTQEADDSKPDLMFGALTPALSEQIQVGEAARPELQKDLRSAGFYRPTALMEYAAVRAVFVFAPLVMTFVVALAVPTEQMGTVLLWGAVAVGLGFSLPRVYVSWRARVRSRQIERGLPLAIDLLTLSLTAGQNLLAALHDVAHELRFTFPDLAQDLAIAHQQAELHSLEHAMTQWSERAHLPEVTNLSLLLIQSERLGTGAASTLIEFSAFLRTSMRQRAEAQANRTSFWMLFPSVFCFWVASAIILIGPAYVEFAQQRQRSSVHLNEMKANINRANDRKGVIPPPANSMTPAEAP